MNNTIKIKKWAGLRNEQVFDRLEELRFVEPDWGYGGEIPPTQELLDSVRDGMHKYEQANAPMPYLFPTQDGGLVLHWQAAKPPMFAWIQPDGKALSFYVIDTTLTIEQQMRNPKKLELPNVSAWTQLANWVKYQLGDVEEGKTAYEEVCG